VPGYSAPVTNPLTTLHRKVKNKIIPGIEGNTTEHADGYAGSTETTCKANRIRLSIYTWKIK
jgi:hypothetical protein